MRVYKNVGIEKSPQNKKKQLTNKQLFDIINNVKRRSKAIKSRD